MPTNDDTDRANLVRLFDYAKLCKVAVRIYGPDHPLASDMLRTWAASKGLEATERVMPGHPENPDTAGGYVNLEVQYPGLLANITLLVERKLAAPIEEPEEVESTCLDCGAPHPHHCPRSEPVSDPESDQTLGLTDRNVRL